MQVPVWDQDFYSDAVIADPLPHYAALRALGPVVWLPRNGCYALPRHAEAVEALRQPLVFSSARGLSLSPRVNALLKGSTLNSDPPQHDRTRAVTGAPLLPGALRGTVEARVRAAAEGLVETLVARGEIDAIADLATYLPLTIVAELVGLPEAGQGKLLTWASATFNLFADDNPRAQAAFADLKDLAAFLAEYGRPGKLKPGGWAARIFEVGPERGIDPATCAQLMRDYINPSLDTTISATGQAIGLFADNPDQWDLLRARPELIPNAIEEVVRLATPIRAFSRHVARDVGIGGTTLPEGARVLVIYASANRDERAFPDPDRFDIARDTSTHLGFGMGVHMCMGMHLARLEIAALLEALRTRVARFERTGPATVAMNNTIRAWASLPVRLVPGPLAAPDPGRMAAEAPVAQAGEDWLEAVVTARMEAGEGVVALTLESAGAEPLPAFEPGAHVDVQVASGVVRQYSLAGDPQDRGRWRLGVLREPASRGGSAGVHDAFHPGRPVRLGRPRNHFPLRPAGETLLVAGGIGLTPLLAMAHALRRQGAAFTLHACARSAARLPFAAELAGFGDAVRVHLDDGAPGQRLDPARDLAPGPDRRLYVCGPGGFMDWVTGAAARLGWDPARVHLERFGAEIDASGAPFTVEARTSGVTVEVAPGQTIAAALTAAGVRVATSCQSGVCGTCLTRVIEGRPDHRDLVLTEAEKAAGERMAICCSRAQTRRLVLAI